MIGTFALSPSDNLGAVMNSTGRGSMRSGIDSAFLIRE